MTTEIFIDEDKDIVIPIPDFEYEIIHTELNTQFNIKKIWIKRI